jgi:predicted AAA+ superfamily ATPase
MKMNIHRYLTDLIRKRIGQQKVLIVYGSRRTGKSFIMQQLYAENAGRALFLNAEDFDDRDRLTKRTAANYKQLTGSKKLVLIDEAQHIPEAGKALKLFIDSVPGITIIASGSSSFDLINKTGKPLVGRNYTYHLYPIAQCELKGDHTTVYRQLEERLIFGSYPELWSLQDEKEKAAYLKSLVQGYLLKDIFVFREIRNSDKIYQLLKLLAWQAGNEVSLNEIARQLGINKSTVEHYLDLLTKIFIIYSLGGYGGNLRKEVVKSRKWYFYDNGIRNAIISDFSPLQNRNDAGFLWEQYFLSERQKFNASRQHFPEYYFWRTYDQQEIDFIEADGKKISAFETKWGKQKAKLPTAFANTYPAASFNMVNKENYLEWIQ